MVKKFFVAIAVAAMAMCVTSCMEELKDASYEVLTESSVVENGKVRNLPTDPKELLIDNGQERFTFIYEGEVNKMDRKVEVWGEETDTVRTPNKNFILTEKETVTSSNTWEGDNDLRWSGTEQTAKTYWELSNGQYVFSFATNRRSCDAICIAGDYPVKFPHLEWSLESSLTPSDPYTISLRDSLFNATRFDAEAIYTASVKEGFGNDVKNYKLVNTLVVLEYIVPDPEDEVTGTYTKAWVEKRSEETLLGTVQKWERHTLIPDVLVATETGEFNVNFAGTTDPILDVENFDYKTTANPWNSVGVINFYATASNGIKANEFKPYFSGRADAGKTIMGVYFKAEVSVEFAKQQIGEASFVEENNQYFYIRPYTGTANLKYTVSVDESSASIEKTAEYGRSLRMKADDQLTNSVENLKFVFEGKAEANKMWSVEDKNSWEIVTCNYGKEISREAVSVEMEVSSEVSGTKATAVESREDLGKVKITKVTKGDSKVTSRKEGDVTIKTTTTPWTVEYSDGNVSVVNTNWDKATAEALSLGYAEIVGVTAVGVDTMRVSENVMKVTPKLNVAVEIHRPTETKSAEVKDYVITDPYEQVYAEKDELIGKRAEGIATPKEDGTGFDLVANFYEIWSISNEKLVHTDNGEMTFSFVARKGNDVIGKDAHAFKTTVNGLVGEKKGTYTSTLSDGSASEQNIYDWTADRKVTFTYNDLSVVFDADIKVNELSSTIGNQPTTKTINGASYDAYPYENRAEFVYTVSGQSMTKADKVNRDILIAQAVDELVDRWGEGKVTKNGDVLVGTAKFYEQWSLSGTKEVHSESKNFKFNLDGSKGEDIFTTSAAFATTGKGWSGNGNFSYTDTASNGKDSFNNVYTGSADKDVTVSYDGMKVVFKAELVISEAGQTIGQPSAKTVSGVNYNAYPYTNKVQGVYTVSTTGSSESLSKNADAKRNILVAADNFETVTENYDYNFEAEANGNTLVSSINDNIWENNTYNNGAYVSGDKKSMHMELSATAPALEDESFAKKAEMGQNNIKSVTKLAASSKRVSRDGIAVDEVTTPYEVTMKNGRKFNIIAKYDRPVDGSLSYAEITNITKAGCESTPNGDTYVVTPKYNVAVELHDNSKPATRAANVQNYVIENPYRELYEPQDELVSKRSEGIATPNGNGFDLTANFYETWSLSGEKLVNTQNGEMTFDITAENGEDVIAENINFTTTSNGMKGDEKGTYSSTMSNGTVKADNNYNWNADKKATFKYDGQTVEFVANFEVVEVSTSIKNIPSDKTVNGVAYDAYPYTNKVQGVYTIKGQSVTKDASVSRDILVVKETPKVIPDDWGKIQGAAITAVPAHSIGNDRFADGDGVQTAHKCLAIRTNKGYIPVVFLMSEVVPTEAQILAGDFTSGNFGAEWNSGCDVYRSGKWIPAKAEDAGTSIKYRTNVGNRSISNETLEQWGWRAGQSYSTRVAVDGYTFNVSEDGTLTVIYGGNVVMSIR